MESEAALDSFPFDKRRKPLGWLCFRGQPRAQPSDDCSAVFEPATGNAEGLGSLDTSK